MNLKKKISNILPMILILGLGSACQGKKKIKIAKVESKLQKITKETPKETRDYSEFVQLLYAGHRFRADFLEGYTIACQANALDDSGTNRPSVNAFHEILSVFDQYSRGNHYGGLNRTLSFFGENSQINVKKLFGRYENQKTFVKNIYDRVPQPGDDVRFLGALKVMVELNTEFEALAEDRLKEIAGSKETTIKNGDYRFFEKANFLVNMKLSLEFQNANIDKYMKLQIKDWNAGSYKHELSGLHSVVNHVSKKRDYSACNKLNSAFGLKEKESDSEICTYRKNSEIIWEEFGKQLKIGNFPQALVSLRESKAENDKTLDLIDQLLQKLGVEIPASS